MDFLKDIPIPPPVNISQKIDHEELHIRAYKDSTYQFYKSMYLKTHISNFMDDGTMPCLPKTPMMMALVEQARDAVNTKPPFMLVTVNVRDGVSYTDLKKYVEKFVRNRSVSKYFYTYEVRKADGEGLHCHILVQYTIKPSDFRRSARSTFKHVCKSDNPSILNFKFVDEDKLASKVSYLLLDKSDKKKKSVAIIKSWRTETKIPEFVESNPPLPCRVTQLLITDEDGTADSHSDAKPPSDALASGGALVGDPSIVD